MSAKRCTAGCVCGLIAVALSGCYTPDAARLSAQVRESVVPGMAVHEAMSRLAGAGFQCHATTRAPEVDCHRSRPGAVLYSCVERVVLQQDAMFRSVAAVDVPPIACAGL